jgi:hypothetical protein
MAGTFRYRLAALCVFSFLAAQTFQELAYHFWIPVSHGPEDDLRMYPLPVDRARAILIFLGIVALIVPFVVIALRYFRMAPLASVLGAIFGTAFIGFEISERSVDFFFVGEHLATEFANASSGAGRELVVQRFSAWIGIVHAWYLPLMLCFLGASCCFAFATWSERKRGGWYYLAPIAFAINAVRLLGRILSTYLGQHWLDGLNGQLYFPIVFSVHLLLFLWFLALAREKPDLAVEKGNLS